MWIASRFHPVMFSERVQQHLTVNKDSLQEEHLKALKARAQKRLEEQNRQNCAILSKQKGVMTILSIQKCG